MSDYYWEHAIINHFLRGVTQPAVTPYVGLFGEDGLEVSASGYARQAPGFIAPQLGATENEAAILFPEIATDAGNITYFGFFTALSGGDLMLKRALTIPKIWQAGNTFEIKAGDLIQQIRFEDVV